MQRQIQLIDNALPDNSGYVWWETYAIKNSNKIARQLIWLFAAPEAFIVLYGQFSVPGDYVGSPKLNLVWTAWHTDNNFVKWRMDYSVVPGDDVNTLDVASFAHSASVLDHLPSAVDNRLTISIPLTAADFSPGSTCEFAFGRDSAGSNFGVDDTAANPVGLVGAIFEYVGL